MKLYRYAWGNNEKRATLKGRLCRVVARGRMNSILVEFVDNGQREVTSRNAVRLLSDKKTVRDTSTTQNGPTVEYCVSSRSSPACSSPPAARSW